MDSKTVAEAVRASTATGAEAGVGDTLTVNTKRRILVGPWRGVQEFREVYELIYGDNASDTTRNFALERLHKWTYSRMHLTPAAILATSVILDVQRKDASGSYTRSDLQLLYSYAVVRFFNFVSSTAQTHQMRSMYDIARELQLDTFVVDMRHTCAHGTSLLRLEPLQLLAKYCMRWLRDYYWRPQWEQMREVADVRDLWPKDAKQFHVEGQPLFDVYYSALFCYAKGANNKKTAKRMLHSAQRRAHLEQFLEQRNIQSLREVLDVVVSELSGVFKRSVGVKEFPEYGVNAILDAENFLKIHASESHILPTSADQQLIIIEASQSLFRLLAAQGFIETLFHRLLALCENDIEPKERRSGASFWATQIAAGFVAFRKCIYAWNYLQSSQDECNEKLCEYDFSTLNAPIITKKLRKLLVDAGVDRKRTLIFGDPLLSTFVLDSEFFDVHLKKISQYTAPVLKTVLAIVNEPAFLTTEELEALNAIIDAAQNDLNTTPEPSNKNKLLMASDLIDCLLSKGVKLNETDFTERKEVKRKRKLS